MDRLKEKIKAVPRYGWICGILYFCLQYGMYRLADWITRLTGMIDRAFCPKIAAIDDMIPVIPVFAVIYLFSYVFWICGPIAASLTSRRNFINYIVGLSMAYLVGFLIFVFLPSYMDRAAEGIIEISQRPGIFNRMLAMIYGADGSNYAFNLFPSYHCLISLYCYFGVRKQPEISKGFRAYSLIMTILICLSTVFTKQHYFVDMPAGLAISVLCYVIVNKWDPGKKYAEKKA